MPFLTESPHVGTIIHMPNPFTLIKEESPPTNLNNMHKIPPHVPKRTFIDHNMFLFFIAVLLAIIMSISGSFLLLGKETLSISVPTPQKQEVIAKQLPPQPTKATSKTYTNTKQLYSLTYPSSWNLFSESIGAKIASYAGTVITTAERLDPLSEAAPQGHASIIISIIAIDKRPTQTLSQYIQVSTLLSTQDKRLLTKARLGSYESIAYSPVSNSVTYFISHDTYIYSLETIFNTASQKDDIKQILNSFQFISTEILDTSTWKSYENQDLGYSFSYPQNFRVRDRGTSVTITDEEDTKYIEIGTFHNPDTFLCKTLVVKNNPPVQIKNITSYTDCGSYYYGYFIPLQEQDSQEKLQIPIKFYTNENKNIQLVSTIASTFEFN